MPDASLSIREQQALHQLLCTWGALTRLELGASLGSLSSHFLQNLSTLGVNVRQSRRGIEWPARAIRVDGLIQQLNQHKPKWADAIKYHYVETGNIRKKAKAKGLPKSTYFERIQKGRDWLSKEWRQIH